jgi:uncharacterized protein with HEPN domain
MAASKSPQLRLFHIRDETDGMASALENVTFADYQESYTLRRAAERAVQIVSEAAKSLPPDMLARHSEAPWNAIIGIGNILRHEYQRIDDRRLWEIVTVHLPELRPVIMAMIDELKRKQIGRRQRAPAASTTSSKFRRPGRGALTSTAMFPGLWRLVRISSWA